MGPLSNAAGAVFYVLAGQAQYCMHQLQAEGLAAGLILPPEQA